MLKQRCKKCGRLKKFDEFFSNNSKTREPRSICKKCDVIRRRENYYKDRKKIIEFYTKGKNDCQLCGCKNIVVLDVDHINGGGYKERKKFRNTTGIYRDIIRRNFPSGFRILCRNCNWIEYIKRLKQKMKGGRKWKGKNLKK